MAAVNAEGLRSAGLDTRAEAPWSDPDPKGTGPGQLGGSADEHWCKLANEMQR